jgi:microcompartment protein CcmK/EutM
MILAQVTARVTGSVQHPCYYGRPLYAVRPQLADGSAGGSFLALDTVGCALGDEVLVARVPGMARTVLGVERAPVRSMILGILDAHPS